MRLKDSRPAAEINPDVVLGAIEAAQNGLRNAHAATKRAVFTDGNLTEDEAKEIWKNVHFANGEVATLMREVGGVREDGSASAHRCCRDCGTRLGYTHAEGCPLGPDQVLTAHLPETP